jgi:hypothetical protein
MTCDDRRALVDDREDRAHDQAHAGAAPDDESIAGTVKEPAGPPRLDVSACSFRSSGHRRHPRVRKPADGRNSGDRDRTPLSYARGRRVSGGRWSSAIARDGHVPDCMVILLGRQSARFSAGYRLGVTRAAPAASRQAR